MTKARLALVIRWILTLALVIEIGFHAHWAVTLFASLVFVALEVLSPAIIRNAQVTGVLIARIEKIGQDK